MSKRAASLRARERLQKAAQDDWFASSSSSAASSDTFVVPDNVVEYESRSAESSLLEPSDGATGSGSETMSESESDDVVAKPRRLKLKRREATPDPPAFEERRLVVLPPKHTMSCSFGAPAISDVRVPCTLPPMRVLLARSPPLPPPPPQLPMFAALRAKLQPRIGPALAPPAPPPPPPQLPMFAALQAKLPPRAVKPWRKPRKRAAASFTAQEAESREREEACARARAERAQARQQAIVAPDNDRVRKRTETPAAPRKALKRSTRFEVRMLHVEPSDESETASEQSEAASEQSEAADAPPLLKTTADLLIYDLERAIETGDPFTLFRHIAERIEHKALSVVPDEQRTVVLCTAQQIAAHALPDPQALAKRVIARCFMCKRAVECSTFLWQQQVNLLLFDKKCAEHFVVLLRAQCTKTTVAVYLRRKHIAAHEATLRVTFDHLKKAGLVPGANHSFEVLRDKYFGQLQKQRAASFDFLRSSVRLAEQLNA